MVEEEVVVVMGVGVAAKMHSAGSVIELQKRQFYTLCPEEESPPRARREVKKKSC